MRDRQTNFWKRVDKSPGFGPNGDCWAWTGNLTTKGYGRFRFENGGQRAHRFSWILHNGPIPDGLNVLHKCDNPPCTNPVHLFLGTVDENNQDRYKKDRYGKLTMDEVRQVRDLLAYGFKCPELAVMFGLTYQGLYSIKSGRSWPDVKGTVCR